LLAFLVEMTAAALRARWVVVVGVLLANAASHDAVGRFSTHVDRWVAADRTNALNRATHPGRRVAPSRLVDVHAPEQ
jgi:hypothetical protein